MKQYTFEGKEVSIPESWHEVTVEQAMKMLVCEDESEMVAVFINLPTHQVRLSKDLVSYFAIKNTISKFIQEKLPVSKPTKFVFNKEVVQLPSDLGEATIGQYEDLKMLCNEYFKGEQITDLNYSLSFYVKMVAIYLQPVVDKSSYDYKRAEQLESDLYNCSVVEVAEWGTFFIQKFTELSNGILNGVLQSDILQKKNRPGFRIFQKCLDFSSRYFQSLMETFRSRITS
jgi:hypothetical protein